MRYKSTIGYIFNDFFQQIRDLELEIDEEKRRHAESVKILRKKERSLKELVIQSEEDHKNVQLLQEALDKVNQKVNIYKRQLQEQVHTNTVINMQLDYKRNRYLPTCIEVPTD